MRIENEKNNEFVLSDFYAAAFLKACGVFLIGINKSDPRRYRFVFEDGPKRAGLISDFFAGKAKVDPRQFVAAIKDLKNLMYSDALAASEHE